MPGKRFKGVFQIQIGRGVAQSGSAPEWGSGGRRFESDRPDQIQFPPFSPAAGPRKLIIQERYSQSRGLLKTSSPNRTSEKEAHLIGFQGVSSARPRV